MKTFIKKTFYLDKSTAPLLQLISLLTIFSITKNLFDAVIVLSIAATLAIGMKFLEVLLNKLNIEAFGLSLMLLISGAFAILISVILQNHTTYNVVCASVTMFWYIYAQMTKSSNISEVLSSVGKSILVPTIMLIPFSFIKELLYSGNILQSFTKNGISIIHGDTVPYANSLSFVLLFIAVILFFSKNIFKNKPNCILDNVEFKGLTKAVSVILLFSAIIGILSTWLLHIANNTFILSHIVLLAPYVLTGSLILAYNSLMKDIDLPTTHSSIILIASICLSQINDIKAMLTTLFLFCIPLYIILVYGEFYSNDTHENTGNKIIRLLAYASIITLAL